MNHPYGNLPYLFAVWGYDEGELRDKPQPRGKVIPACSMLYRDVPVANILRNVNRDGDPPGGLPLEDAGLAALKRLGVRWLHYRINETDVLYVAEVETVLTRGEPWRYGGRDQHALPVADWLCVGIQPKIVLEVPDSRSATVNGQTQEIAYGPGTTGGTHGWFSDGRLPTVLNV